VGQNHTNLSKIAETGKPIYYHLLFETILTMQTIVLASSSPYRKSILAKLRINFISCSPDIDEQQQPEESAQALVTRLAEQKARAIRNDYPDALIIGSDQVAVLGNHILTKPGNYDTAVEQLTLASGNVVTFLTGLCLYNAKTDHYQIKCVPFNVHFRRLDQAQIARYLKAEQPYDCAGSFKSEGLGISLFERLEGDDPNTLVGLPLIELIRMLQTEGVTVP
jgi:MAF protein